MGIIKNILLVRLPHKDYIPICFFYSHALWPVVDQIQPQCQPINQTWLENPQLRGMKKVAFVDKNWVITYVYIYTIYIYIYIYIMYVMCIYRYNVCDVCMYIYIYIYIYS